ncbi:MAG: LacI family DNA-binding transcriptional regulator [Campylobacteraceae bacterium]|nr:LacI family DNA-binding transcriptional regulator [Campylobacteraceae bacterium]
MGIRKIAELAKVSTATVSRVLNTPELVKKNTREKVLRIAKEMDYHKYNSSYIPSLKKDEIAVIIPDVLNTFFARILEGVVKQAKELSLNVNLYLTHDNLEDELEAVNGLLEKQTRGVILIRSRNKEFESSLTINKLNTFNIPFVLVDRDISSSDNSGIFLSNANAVYDATNLLLNDSYKNIHIITGPKGSLNSNQRLEGFKESYSKHGILIKEEMIHTGDFTVDSGLEITRKILELDVLPDAIFSIANQITVGCLKAISEKNLVLGKDIKLFSFNKLDASYIDTFNISYIEHPVELMGEKSVTILKNKFVGTKGLIREIMTYKIHY